jgi:hypothetical protein
MLRDIGLRIVYGVAIGLGIVGSLSAGFYVTNKFRTKPQSTSFDAQASGLVVKDTRQLNDSFGASFVGTVRNNGSWKWKVVWVEVDLFDADGKILDVCTELLDPILLPKAEEHFRVLCADTAKDHKPTHASYKVHLRDATKIRD